MNKLLLAVLLALCTPMAKAQSMTDAVPAPTALQATDQKAEQKTAEAETADTQAETADTQSETADTQLSTSNGNNFWNEDDAPGAAKPVTDAATPAVPELDLQAQSPEAEALPIIDTAPAIPSEITPASPVSEPGLTGADVFERLRARFSQPACPDQGETIQRWRKRYAGHPKVFARHLAEILPLLEFVTGEIERSGLPAEFAFIPVVESWYRPDAIGVGGPAGMWQMIASTARNHGIHIKPGYDGRLSPVESTRAALSYLKVLYGMFAGDWQATVMAYNAGEYRLLKAFKVQGSRSVSAQQRKPHGLSAITYDYVYKLQALSCLISEPERYGLTLPVDLRFTPLVPILVAADTSSLDQLAKDSQVSIAALRQLNPGYRSGRIVGGVPRMVLMPGTPIVQDKATAAAAVETAAAESTQASENADENAGNAGLHEVRNGETLWSIAKRYGLSLDQLRKLNKLGHSTVIRAGRNLKVVP